MLLPMIGFEIHSLCGKRLFELYHTLMSATGIEIIASVSSGRPILDDFHMEEIVGVVIKIFFKATAMPVKDGIITVKGKYPCNDLSLFFCKPEFNVMAACFKKI
jgi:hypothetical protein